MKSQRLRFTNSLGIELAARLDRPDAGEPAAYAVFSHCFTCNKDYKFIRQVSRVLTEHGIAVLCLDFTGLGESSGNFEDSNFSTGVADVITAAGFLAGKFCPPALLIGHSLGGTVMLAAAPELPGIRAVATINAPFEPRHIFHHFSDIEDQIDREGEAESRIGGKTYRITRQLLHDLRGRRMAEAVRTLDAALLILHAPDDETVAIENAGRIFEAARHPKSFIALDGADHLLSREADARYAGQVIAAWAARYLDPEAGVVGDPARQAGVVTASIDTQSYRTEITAGGHRLLADEPPASGGEDLGPTPYELLAASLGACTCITLRMYADRKGWPLEAATVRLRHEKVHASDCADCPDAQRRIDRIVREIELKGGLDAGQRQRLFEIADRCPVHRTLQDHVVIDTRRGEPEPS
ncbi:MAG: alpha/beta fold hydrolase [Gammaproteobacteria bacterium]